MLVSLGASGPAHKASILPPALNSKGFQIFKLPFFSIGEGEVLGRVSLPAGEKPKVVQSDLNGKKKIYDLFIS